MNFPVANSSGSDPSSKNHSINPRQSRNTIVRLIHFFLFFQRCGDDLEPSWFNNPQFNISTALANNNNKQYHHHHVGKLTKVKLF
jgi:hypothetical protein